MREKVKIGFRMAFLLIWVGLSVSAASASEQIYYFHNDHLGTPQAMSDASGFKVWEAEYEPFGKAAVNQDPDGDGQIVINNLRFPGQYYDAETGLHYNYYRDYDPATGRYLQPDPIGLRGGLNLYGYAQENPLRFTDPSGRSPLIAGIGIWWGGCAAVSFALASSAYPNPEDDKERHCYASCIMNKCTLWTYVPSFLTGWGFEVAQGATGGSYDPDDERANMFGLESAYKGDCKNKCEQCPVM